LDGGIFSTATDFEKTEGIDAGSEAEVTPDEVTLINRPKFVEPEFMGMK